MQLISDEYRQLNEQLHDSNPAYGVSGHQHTDSVINLSKIVGSVDILDYGCGKSTLARNLPFSIKQYDPAIDKYKALPEPADIVVCTDVLEHIEPEALDEVLKHLASLTKKAGLFTAATRPAVKFLADGRNAHLIVQPAKWWVDKFYEHFDVINFTKANHEISFIVEPKKMDSV